MKKCLFLLVATVASSALAQQNVDITAEQFNSGEANARLTSLGREAAASGKRLVVTAPQQWHAQIAARIGAGGKADIVLKDGFYETLLVRVVDEAAEPVKPEPEVEPKPKPAPPVAEAPKPAPLPVAPKPQPPKAVVAPPPAAPIVETPPPAPEPEPVVERPAPPPPPVAPAPSIAEEPAAPTKPAASAVVDPKAPIIVVAAEPGDADSVRVSMEQRYNEGKRIIESTQTNQLKVGDVFYVGKGAAVVVRREGSRLLRMWLIGSLNVNQLGIEGQGSNKYKVLNGTIE